ncbi:hypothetical protein [Thermococcus nautili]|uniref:Uncharacterized protein n=1 Tax=Thermococcus nautili TaxID=195522 RepID=W8NRS0_9EURY|nr:hypothetical protein [Thermococcus nautili]AHL21787.1 hypothetical protein BD01_0156 [Thermococcus nautili]
MKKSSGRRFLLFIFVSILALIFVPSTASLSETSAPYWFHQGSFVEYKAVSYHRNGGGFVFNASGVPVSVTGPNITVIFKVLNVTGDIARVKVILSVSTGNVTFAPVTVFYPANGTFKPFWNASDVINVTRMSNNLTRVVLKSLTVGGEYEIKLSAGWVYDLHGNPYGHTVLWDGFTKNETFALYYGKRVVITEVKIINATLNTYYSSFPKPNLLVHSTRVVAPDGQISFFDAFYSPGYRICLSFIMDPIPDFHAVGIYGFMWTDDRALAIDKKLNLNYKIVNGVWPQGVILANVTLGESTTPVVSPPEPSKARYLLPIAVGIAVVAGVVTYRRGR